MKVTEIAQCAKTGPETKYLLVLTDRDQMLMETPGSLRVKIRRFAEMVYDGIIVLMEEYYKDQIKREEEAATSLIKERLQGVPQP